MSESAEAEVKPPPGPKPVRWWMQSCILWICGAYAVLLGLHFFTPNAIQIGFSGDDSHQWVLALAFKEGWVWGKDIVFTYGPLGYLRSRGYHPWMDGWMISLSFLYYGLCGFLSWRLLRPERYPVAGGILMLFGLYALYAWGAPLDLGFDQWILFLYLGGGFFLLRKEDPPMLLVLALVVFGILNFYLKYTFALLSLILAGFLLLQSRGKGVRGQAGFGILVGIYLFGLFIGQYPWEVIWYLWYSWPVASGFSESMMLWGPPWEYLTFLVLSVVVSVCFYWSLFREEGWSNLLLFILWCSGVGFLVWKQSFMRHDAHAMGAGLYLLGTVFFFFIRSLEVRNPAPGAGIRPLIFLFGGVFALGYTGALFENYRGEGHWRQAGIRILAHTPNHLLRDLRQPFAFEELEAAYAKRQAALGEWHDFSGLEGPADFYNSRSGILLSNRIEYAPRPVFQSYSAYTPELIRKNAAHLEGDGAPDLLVTDFTHINRRPPMLADGLSWLSILEDFRPVRQSGRLLIWERVADEEGGDLELELFREGQAVFGETLELEEMAHGWIWLEAEIERNRVGKLQDFLFKSSPVHLEVQLPGEEPMIREVPAGMLETGFWVSPFIDEADHFLRAVYLRKLGASQLLDRGMPALRLKEHQLLLQNFQSTFRYRLYRIRGKDLPVDDSPMVEDRGAAFHGLLERFVGFRAEVGYGTLPRFGTNPDLGPHVFAHAPSRFTIERPGTGDRFTITYGMQPGSWSGGGATDGVQFSVVGLGGGNREALFTDDLRPATRVEDREEQVGNLIIPAWVERLEFETDALGSPNWDWSYWGKIRENQMR